MEIKVEHGKDTFGPRPDQLDFDENNVVAKHGRLPKEKFFLEETFLTSE